jgi:hypothetical protein
MPEALLLTRESGQMLPFDLALVLQYDSGPSSVFLAKISGANISPFLWKTVLSSTFFTVTSYSCKELCNHVINNSLDGSMLLYDAADLSSTTLQTFVFLITMYVTAIKFHYFKSLHLFIFFLPLFIFKNETNTVGFSTY